MTVLPISVVILAHHQDARLTACRASVRWAAEVLLVWTGTEAPPVPQTSAERVLVWKTPVTNFALLRNQSMQKTLHEWVFFLDSDEVFELAGVEEVAAVVANPLLTAASLTRKDVFYGQEMRYGEVGHVRVVRLMKKHQAHFERRVHEVAVPHGVAAASSLVIYHFAHASLTQFLQKIQFYICLEKRERQSAKQRFSLFEAVVFPLAKFFYTFVLLQGFRDGWRGCIYAVMMSIHSYGVRAALYEQ